MNKIFLFTALIIDFGYLKQICAKLYMKTVIQPSI